jgi:26S proteasome regulatory subunit N10
MRNGDYTPTRLEAQADAITFLFNAKTQSNPENTVGLVTSEPNVMVTLTNDIGKILTAIHNIHCKGYAQFKTAVQIAQLVLKHRQNKNQRQRIIALVASPILEDEATLVKLGKKLKKNSVAVDIVSFGQLEDNESKLAAFIEAVNSNDNSHLLSIPPGPHLLSDALLVSPIIQGEDGAPPGFASNFEFGVDPSLDPELALALKLSMEEERARVEKSNPAPAPSAPMTEDEMLAQALALSMSEVIVFNPGR